MRVASIGAVLLTPFCISNFLGGRLAVALGSLLIVLLLVFIGWSISRGRYYQNLVFYVLLPVIVGFMFLTFRQQGVIGALWCYPAAISFYAILPERRAWLANALLLAVVVPSSWLYIDHSLATRVIATLFGVSTFTAIFVHIIYGQQEKLKSLVVTDPLTGLLNRTLLQSTLEEVVAQNSRSGVPTTLLELDVDHFKEINDTYGHEVGDKVLVELAGLMSSNTRESDKVFRLGGEEFLILLYNTGGRKGQAVAEELREKIASHPFIQDSRVTASLGVACLNTGENWQGWLKRADEQLYLAKRRGRNCVAFEEE